MEWVRNRWYHDRPAPGEHTGPWGTVIWRIVAGECWLRAQADPASSRTCWPGRTSSHCKRGRIALEDARVVSHPAGA